LIPGHREIPPHQKQRCVSAPVPNGRLIRPAPASPFAGFLNLTDTLSWWAFTMVAGIPRPSSSAIFAAGYFVAMLCSLETSSVTNVASSLELLSKT
jgi:hypothetical protein